MSLLVTLLFNLRFYHNSGLNTRFFPSLNFHSLLTVAHPFFFPVARNIVFLFPDFSSRRFISDQLLQRLTVIRQSQKCNYLKYSQIVCRGALVLKYLETVHLPKYQQLRHRKLMRFPTSAPVVCLKADFVPSMFSPQFVLVSRS